MWDKIWWQILFDTIFLIIYTVLITTDALHGIKSTALYVILLLMVCWMIIEEIFRNIVDDQPVGLDVFLASRL